MEVHPSLSLNLPTYLNITDFGIPFVNNGTLDDFMNLPNTHFQSYDNTIFFVLGHGSPFGLKLSSNTYLSPSVLVNKIKDNQNVKNSVLFVGQCYSGIFNYLQAKNEDKNKQQLIIIGATELHMSLSSSIQHSNPWCANLFYFYLFNWLGQPFDMDGDGYCSILDAYKYTGAFMNQHIKSITENCLSKYMSLYTEKTKLENQLLHTNSKNKKNDLLLNIKLKTDEMKDELSYFTVKQDAWVLNANHARIIGL